MLRFICKNVCRTKRKIVKTNETGISEGRNFKRLITTYEVDELVLADGPARDNKNSGEDLR